MKAHLSSFGPPCDQDRAGPNSIPNGSVLTDDGEVNRQKDGFAHFTGAYVIKDPAWAESIRGTIIILLLDQVGTDQVGTQHPSFGIKACNARQHVEGWLIGRGSPRFPHHTLRALIVGRGSLLSPGKPTTFLGSFNGSLTKCP